MKRHRLRPRAISLLLCSLVLGYFAVLISASVVTLDSIEIFRTHEWFPSKPIVYFQCSGENMTFLPDVKEKHVFYAFKGEESWQPLVDLPDKKCKRCGIYEKDDFKRDDIFDEWEFCASDFTRSDGKYIHFKDREINATFLCPDCVRLGRASNHSSKPGRNRMHWALIVVICVLVALVFIGGSVIAYKYLQKRRREQEQARFLKLFEEGDEDMEDELGIGPLSHVI